VVTWPRADGRAGAGIAPVRAKVTGLEASFSVASAYSKTASEAASLVKQLFSEVKLF
jgi:hypothetical protein